MPILKRDPSRTTRLRTAFIREIARRFRDLKNDVLQLVVTDDVFGLKDSPVVMDAGSVGRQAWRFLTSDKKLKSFHSWLNKQIDKRLYAVDGSGKPWTSKYIDSAYKQGIMRAYIQSKPTQEMKHKIGFFGETKEQFLRKSFAAPERTAKAELLATRAFEDLKDISSTMANRMGRVLSDSIIRGDNPLTIGRRMAREIEGLSKTRATTIARTEIIHAHAEGQLDTFQEFEIQGVGVEAEWLTAGDELVCPECEALEGRVFTIEEARGLLPRHPNCRCAWVPALTDRKEKGQKRGTRAKQSALKASIRAERPGKSLASALRSSSWLGKELVD